MIVAVCVCVLCICGEELVRISRAFFIVALFVSHELGTSLTVVEVVRDANHAGCACVVRRCGLGGSSASHTAQHQYGGAGSRVGVHPGW
jgi:hypothetical protein